MHACGLFGVSCAVWRVSPVQIKVKLWDKKTVRAKLAKLAEPLARGRGSEISPFEIGAMPTQHMPGPLLCAECRQTKAASGFSRTQRSCNERRRCLRCIGESANALLASQGALSATVPVLGVRSVTIAEPARSGRPWATLPASQHSFKRAARGGNEHDAQRRNPALRIAHFANGKHPVVVGVRTASAAQRRPREGGQHDSAHPENCDAQMGEPRRRQRTDKTALSALRSASATAAAVVGLDPGVGSGAATDVACSSYARCLADPSCDVLVCCSPSSSGHAAPAMRTALRGLEQGVYKQILLVSPAHRGGVAIIASASGPKLELAWKAPSQASPALHEASRILLSGASGVAALRSRGAIQLCRLPELHGRALTDAFVLAEGMQTATHAELKGLLVSALGRGCKLVISGCSTPTDTLASISPGGPGRDGRDAESHDRRCSSSGADASSPEAGSAPRLRRPKSAFTDFAAEVEARGGPRMACVRLPDSAPQLHPTASHALGLLARLEAADGAQAAGRYEGGVAGARGGVFSRLGTARAHPHPRLLSPPRAFARLESAAPVVSPMLVDKIDPPAAEEAAASRHEGGLSVLVPPQPSLSLPAMEACSVHACPGGERHVDEACKPPAGDPTDGLRGYFSFGPGGTTPACRAADRISTLAYENSPPDSDIHTPPDSDIHTPLGSDIHSPPDPACVGTALDGTPDLRKALAGSASAEELFVGVGCASPEQVTEEPEGAEQKQYSTSAVEKGLLASGGEGLSLVGRMPANHVGDAGAISAGAALLGRAKNRIELLSPEAVVAVTAAAERETPGWLRSALGDLASPAAVGWVAGGAGDWAGECGVAPQFAQV